MARSEQERYTTIPTTMTRSSVVTKPSILASDADSLTIDNSPLAPPRPLKINLSDRLVWVTYRGQWWPAILYKSYEELDRHMHCQLNTIMKAQLTMAILHQVQSSRKQKVARLLGRSPLEIVEAERGTYCEFNWMLAKVLSKAMHISTFGYDQDLFLDFHMAMDEVEEILQRASPNGLPSREKESWIQRAFDILDGEVSNGTASKTPSRQLEESISVVTGKDPPEVEIQVKDLSQKRSYNEQQNRKVDQRSPALNSVPEGEPEMEECSQPKPIHALVTKRHEPQKIEPQRLKIIKDERSEISIINEAHHWLEEERTKPVLGVPSTIEFQVTKDAIEETPLNTKDDVLEPEIPPLAIDPSGEKIKKKRAKARQKEVVPAKDLGVDSIKHPWQYFLCAGAF